MSEQQATIRRAKPDSERTHSLEGACRELGRGRSLGYELARRGEFPGLLRLGHKFRVSRVVLDRYIDSGGNPNAIHE